MFAIVSHESIITKINTEISNRSRKWNFRYTKRLDKLLSTAKNFDLKWITSILESFKTNRFHCIHVRISSTQDSILSRPSSIFSHNLMYIWVSSANSINFVPYRKRMSSSGAVYRVNNIGPKTVPWGAPHVKTELLESKERTKHAGRDRWDIIRTTRKQYLVYQNDTSVDEEEHCDQGFRMSRSNLK